MGDPEVELQARDDLSRRLELAWERYGERDQSSFDHSVDSEIGAIKFVGFVTLLDLREAKDMVDGWERFDRRPYTYRMSMTRHEYGLIRRALDEAGFAHFSLQRE